MRRFFAGGLIVLLAWQGLPAFQGYAAPGPAPADGAPRALTESEQARLSGQPVEVLSQRAERSQVFAQPDGTFTEEQTVEPVRVRRGPDWVDVDTTVRTRSDGRVAPVATSVPTVYSGGGTAALAEFGSLVLRWPTALPKPVLKGPKAVYPEVLPGVDLELETFRQGFGYAFLVKDAQAAKNPALRDLRLSVEGMVVKTEKGVRTAYGADGKAVFESPTSVVQDAGPDGNPGARRGNSATGSADGGLSIAPDPAILDDPGAGFPIRIAEQWWPLGQFGWTSVYAQFPNQSYWNGANMGDDRRARSGYSGDWDYPTVTVRSFFHFDLRSMHGKHVLGAELNLLGGYSSACADSTFWLAHSGGVSGGTTWNNQPGTGHTQERRESGFGRTGCANRWVGWDVGSDVHWSNHVQPADHVTFRISGPEGDKMAWRKWDTTSYGQHPKLIVRFNQYPHTPGNLSAAPKPGCAWVPDQPYVSTRTPVLKATAGDPDGGRLSAVFEFWNHGAGAPLREVVVGEQESGSEFQITTPGDLYRDGSTMSWRVKARDPYGAESPWSRWCDITIDLTAPDRKPGVSSTDYPENGSGGAPGKSGRFFFDAANLPDAAGFRYRVSGQGWKFVPATLGSATVDITPLTADPVRLDVTIEDRAGNVGQDNELRPELSNVRKYDFRVNGPTPPTSHWKLDGHHLDTTVPDSAGKHPGTFLGQKARWAKGKAGDALSFLNTADSFVTAGNGPAVDTSTSFTVAAWVRLDSDPVQFWRTAVSQDGEHVSRFALQYRGEGVRRWAFSMMSEDSNEPRIDSAVAYDERFLPRVGVWTHLAGVYDVAERRIRLYVNGVLAGESAHDGRWWSEADKSLLIGRGMWAGNVGDYWPGTIDEVKVYDRALSDVRIDNGPSELDALAQTTVPEAVFALDEGTGTTTWDATGAPRTASVGAATWAPGRDGTTGVRLNTTYEGTDHVIADSPVVRTEDSYTVSAWVKPEKFTTSARTVVSQAGGTMSGFYLQYRWAQGEAAPSWNFFVPQTDTTAPAWGWVKSPAPVVENQWTHLAAVYDESASELRLYVNGVESGPRQPLQPLTWNAGGPLHIGRAMYLGKVVDPWLGTIDEVRVYSGVRSAADITAEYSTTLPNRTRLPVHGRYINHQGDHRGGNGPMPTDYRKEASLGFYLPAGTPNTRMLYSCITSSNNAFTSPVATCEGHKSLGPLGLVYINPPAGVAAVPLSRCRVKDGWQEHFDTITSDCERQVADGGVLGFLLPYTLLSRHQQVEQPFERRSDTGNLPRGYRAQRDLVALPTGGVPGLTGLYLCRGGADTFASTDSACGGKENVLVKFLGGLYPQRPADPAARELFSCAEVGETRERFESTDSTCEGQDVLGSLGFGLDPARVTR